MLIELEQPRAKGIWLRFKDRRFWQERIYEHVPTVCTICGSFGHLSANCSPPESSLGHINADAQRSHPANSEAFAGLDEEQCCRPGASEPPGETEKAEVGKGNSLARNLEESIEPGGWLKPKFFIHSLVLKSPMAAPIVSTNPFDVIGEDPKEKRFYGSTKRTFWHGW